MTVFLGRKYGDEQENSRFNCFTKAIGCCLLQYTDGWE